MNYRKQVLEVYNTWYTNNRPKIEAGKWKLIDKEILINPQNDTLRGLNLIAYLPASINLKINKYLLPKLSSVISESGWTIPDKGRHITILDIIPHNSGLSIKKIKSLQKRYVEAINQSIKNFKTPVKVGLEGVFASTDGITIQGFPLDESLSELRNALRNILASEKLINLETKKYNIETAHVALIKFVQKLDDKKLLKVIDSLRDIPLGTFEIKEIVLNISSRYDKIKTIEVVDEFNILNPRGW